MLKAIKNKWFLYIKISRSHFCGFAYKLVCVDNKFIKPLALYRGENSAYNFIKMMRDEFGYYKKLVKKHFNKNSIMSEEEEEN